MELNWTVAEPLSAAFGLSNEEGVYRLWESEAAPPLEYIGETANLKSRLDSHRRNRSGSLRFSYAVLLTLDAAHQRQEIESDLLDAHQLACQRSPRNQY